MKLVTYGDLVAGGLDGGLYIQGAGGIPGLSSTLYPAPDIILTDHVLSYGGLSEDGGPLDGDNSSKVFESPLESPDDNSGSDIWLPVLIVLVVLIILTSLIIVGRRWGS